MFNLPPFCKLFRLYRISQRSFSQSRSTSYVAVSIANKSRFGQRTDSWVLGDCRVQSTSRGFLVNLWSDGWTDEQNLHHPTHRQPPARIRVACAEVHRHRTDGRSSPSRSLETRGERSTIIIHHTETFALVSAVGVVFISFPKPKERIEPWLMEKKTTILRMPMPVHPLPFLWKLVRSKREGKEHTHSCTESLT